MPIRAYRGSARPGTTIAHMMTIDPKRDASLARNYPNSAQMPDHLSQKASAVLVSRMARNAGTGVAVGGTALGAHDFLAYPMPQKIMATATYAGLIGLAWGGGNAAVKYTHTRFDDALQASQFRKDLSGKTPFAVLKGNRLVATPTCPRWGGRERVLIDANLANPLQLRNYQARRERNARIVARADNLEKFLEKHLPTGKA